MADLVSLQLVHWVGECERGKGAILFAEAFITSGCGGTAWSEEARKIIFRGQFSLKQNFLSSSCPGID